jgi:hypothetical protein
MFMGIKKIHEKLISFDNESSSPIKKTYETSSWTMYVVLCVDSRRNKKLLSIKIHLIFNNSEARKRI